MTKQFAIAAGDHVAGTPQQTHDGMAGRGVLPFVTGEPAGAEDDLGDLLLGRAFILAIGGLQHAASPGALLRGQARIAGHVAAMQGGKKAVHGFEAVEAVGPKRDHGRERPTRRRVGREHEMKVLAIAQVAQMMQSIFRADHAFAVQERAQISGRVEGRWRAGEDDAAGIFLRQPEDVRVGRPMLGMDREIAGPTSAPHRPSVPPQGARPG